MNYLVGVDGGQSNTSCVVTNEDCDFITRKTGGSVIHLQGDKSEAQLEKVLNDSLKAAVKEISDKNKIKTVCLGMTGVQEGSKSQKIIKEKVLDIIDPPILKIVGDINTILLGATAGKPGICAYGGTGSVAIGRNENGEIKKCGGHGYIIDDEGGGYDIGIKCLRAAFRSADGYGPETSLQAALADHFSDLDGLSSLRNKIYYEDGLSRHKIAELARVVYQEARTGDRIAGEILAEAGEQLGNLVLCVARKLDMMNEKFLYTASGGVLNAGEFIKSQLISRVNKEAPEAFFQEPICQPIGGTIIMGLESLGIPLNESRLKKLKSLK